MREFSGTEQYTVRLLLVLFGHCANCVPIVPLEVGGWNSSGSL